MSDNKTKPTNVKVDTFLDTIDANRRAEALELITIMEKISNDNPVMWGPSIIGFGSIHYKYESGREGDMPKLAFSPRKSAITIYFPEGFNHHSPLLKKLGKYKNSVSCLYINRLQDIEIKVLTQMLDNSNKIAANTSQKATSVEEYVQSVPALARPQFDKLREIVKSTLPGANEVVSYGIVGYKIDDKRPRVFVSGWKDHVAMYPIPKDDKLKQDLKNYIKGKGTLWFSLDEELPREILIRAVESLVE